MKKSDEVLPRNLALVEVLPTRSDFVGTLAGGTAETDVNQSELDFSAPIQTRGSLRTRHASAQGALSANERVGCQMLQLLTAYKLYGDLTDAETAEHTGLMRTSVIPRRRELMKRGLVVEVGHRKNPGSGVTNTTFGLAGGRDARMS